MEGRAKKRLKLALLATLGGIATLVLLVISLLAALDAGYLRGPLASAISSRADRPVRFASVSIDLFDGPPRITARNVIVESPAWLAGDPLAEIGSLELTLQPTLRHPLKLRTVSLERAVLHLRRDEADRANWRLKETAGRRRRRAPADRTTATQRRFRRVHR